MAYYSAQTARIHGRYLCAPVNRVIHISNMYICPMKWTEYEHTGELGWHWRSLQLPSSNDSLKSWTIRIFLCFSKWKWTTKWTVLFGRAQWLIWLPAAHTQCITDDARCGSATSMPIKTKQEKYERLPCRISYSTNTNKNKKNKTFRIFSQNE